MLEQLFISRIRIKLLSLYLGDMDTALHVRGLVRKVDEEINSVRRELKNLKDFGLLKSKKEGNKIVFMVNKKCPFLYELQDLFAKDEPTVLLITNYLQKIKNIKLGLLTNNFFTQKYDDRSDSDIILVGSPDVDVVKKEVELLEKELKRTIRVSLLSTEKFDFKKKSRDQQLREVLQNKYIVLIGDRRLLL